jgi:pimeloyl-ACP methyl ester carboxylesterase
MPVIEANDVKLHTQQMGAAGSPVVMLHGLLIGTLASWYFSVAPRLAQSHRVMTYDLRGHGLSERPSSGYGLRAMEADLESIIDSQFDAPVALVGHSFGGAIALRYAIDHPDRVSKLVLVETPLPVMTAEALQFFYSQSLDTLIGLLPESQQKTLGRNGQRQGRLSKQVVQLVTATSMNDDILAEPDIPDAELASVNCPALLCYGRDSFFSVAERDRLLKVLPNASLTLLPGGHFLPYEAPVELAEAIRGFLDG